MSDRSKASEIQEQKKLSRDWLTDNFYPQWERAYKNYKLEPDPEIGPDGKVDTELTSIGMPDTWSFARRQVARVTAQIPNFKFRSRYEEVGNLISRTLMYQWDRAGIQRLQKRHALQATIFGWSPRPWYWLVDEGVSSKRVNILDPELDPVSLDQVARTYEVDTKALMDAQQGPVLRAQLLAEKGRGGLLPVKYTYKYYEGPKADFLFVGDCYPEPDFESIQTSQWFIVERRRDKAFLKRLVTAYPQFAKGVQTLLEKNPKGSVRYHQSNETDDFRRRLESAIGRTRNFDDLNEISGEWTITERHIPGDNPKLALVAEDSIFLGEIDYPYDLAGKIAFTECVLIDDLLCGIGDSIPRVMRGLQLLHERQVCRRVDLVHNILRPLIGTSNRELYEDPGLIKRHGGFRMVWMRGQGDLWVQPEQAAMAAAAVGLNDEAGLMRLYQMLTGDTNMSMAANVDPQQGRTATGARIMQVNQDILTKDLNDSMAYSSLSADGEMMRLLNRAELSEPIEFNEAPYKRIYAKEEDSWKDAWVKIEPLQFQVDGEIVAEVGSTIADDDETRVAKATNLYQAAMASPNLFNLETARDEFLIAHGKGPEIAKWRAQPQPPAPEMRSSLSIAVKFESLSAEAQAEVLGKAGIAAPDGPAMQRAQSGLPLTQTQPPQEGPVQ